MSSTLDKEKEKEEAEKKKRKEKKERQKHTEEENLKKINLQQSEKIRLNYVFNQLCELENEKSSDDDSKSKKYLRDINEKAKKKQMKIPKTKYKSKLEMTNKKNYKHKDEEDDEPKEEGKKLFYLTQFLMYDKDEKHEICVEDTLEILCARHQNNVDQALDAIFDIEKIDENGKKKKVKRETISFLEYSKRMHELSMKKRNEISNLKKTFCDNLKKEALKEARERAERKNFEENQL